jgi:glycerol uptake facilitator-like aquaporin
VLANALFGVPTALSTTDRATWPHLLAEVVATAGLVLVIFALVRTERAHLAAPAVGAYIGAAYFFTSSTSFANPAITVGRAVSDTFAGIAPASVLPFIGAQLVGAVLAWLLVRALFPVADPDPAIVPDGSHSEAAAS